MEIKSKGHDRRAKHPYDKRAALIEIRLMIDKYGAEAGAKLARTQYPEVDPSTWSRWMKDAGVRRLNQAEARIHRAMEIIPADVLPMAPSPGVVARAPARAQASFDFMGEFHALYADGKMLREHSVTKNEDGSEKIKIANYFAGSIKIRSDLMERLIQASQMLYDWDQMKAFYDEIVEVVAEVDPEVAAKILDRLAELNKRRGFNLSG